MLVRDVFQRAGHPLRATKHSRCAALEPSKMRRNKIAMFRQAGSHHDHRHDRLTPLIRDMSFLLFFAEKQYFFRMRTMVVSLPESLKSFVDEQVSGCGYSTRSECIRPLIRKDQGRQQLRGLLLEGAASRPTGYADGAYFDIFRQRATQSKRE